jgi:ligand-binding sensor domain-containing protein/two-component sensor histidine kinase
LRSFLLFLFILLHFNSIANESFCFKQFYLGDGLPSGQVYQVVQDKDNYLWFATDRGACRYNGKSFKTYDRKHGLTDEVVFGFHLQDNGRLWFYTYDEGICYYENDTILKPAFNTALIAEVVRQKTIITSLFVSPDGTIWIGLKNMVVLKISPFGEISKPMDKKGDPFLPKLISLEATHNGKDAFISSSAYRKKKDSVLLYYPNSQSDPVSLQIDPFYWKDMMVCSIGDGGYMLSMGFHLYKINKGKVEAHYKLPHEIMYALHLDQNKQLWVGTTNGVFKFNNTDLSEKPKHYLSGNYVSSVVQDHEGGYWFTSLENGVFYLPGLSVASYPANTTKNLKFNQISANENGILTINKKCSAIFFEGGEIDKVSQFQLPKRGMFDVINRLEYLLRVGKIKTRLEEVKTLIPQVTTDNLHYTRNDEHSEYGWKYGLGILSFCVYNTDSVLMEFDLNNKNFQCAAISDDLKTIWLGASGGLFKYVNDSLQRFEQSGQPIKSRVIDLDLLNDSILLISTRGDGILKYNQNQHSLTKIEGFSNDYCNESYVDSKGTVWVATYSGVVRIDGIETDNPVCYLLTEKNGLASNEVHDIAEYQNQIWVTASKGLSYWNMNWVPEGLTFPAKLKSILVNEQPISNLEELGFRQNNLEFRFECIRFREPVEYLYRLKGLHENWIHTPDPNASYSALSPGSYTFQFKAKNQSSIFQSIPVYIKPPFWLSHWFYVGLAVLLIGVLVIFFRIRYRLISKQDKLYQLFIKAEEKALLAQVNPHFLFNSFNSILELLANSRYQSARTYIYSFARLMRLILQSSRETELSLKQELKLVEQYVDLEQLHNESPIDFKISLPEHIDAESMVIPPMILQPYVENALKHGIKARKDGNAFLHIEVEINDQREMLIRIADNGLGYGFNQRKKVKRKSYGLQINRDRLKLFGQKRNVKVSISNLNPLSKTFPGTVVSLTLPYITKKHETTNSTEVYYYR